MTRPIEEDRSNHAVCKLRTALRLIAGRDVYVPALAYPAFQPSRLARALQMGASVFALRASMSSRSRVVSGPSLAYLSGEIDYSENQVGRQALRLLAKKQPFFVVRQEEPAASIAALIGCDATPAPSLRFSSQCVLVVRANYQGLPAVFHIGSCDESREEVRRQARGLMMAADLSRAQVLAPLLISSRCDAGLEVTIETELQGATLPFDWARIDHIMEFWLGRPAATGITARPGLYQELMEVCESFPAHQYSLHSLADGLMQWHSSLRLPGDFTHGDLWHGNVLFSGDAISGIIDWEWARPDGLPLLDALHLLFMSHSVSRTVSIAESLRQFWTDSVEDREIDIRLEGLRQRYGLYMSDLKMAGLLLWFDYLRERVIRGRMPTRTWTEDMLPRTIPILNEQLTRGKRGARETAA